MSLDISTLTVDSFEPSAEAVVLVDDTNDTISACPTSCACCD